jgi:hypothetical protein
MSINVTVVSADEVRAWAAKRGIEVAAHGRLSAEVVAAFNKAHKVRQYVVTRHQPARVVKVSGLRKKGNRSIPVTLNTTYPEVRAWAFTKGYTLGERGRIPATVLSEFAAAR